MKKILSFVLVLAMIASMMCVSVSATTTFDKMIVGSTQTVETPEGGEETIRVGSETFNPSAIDAGIVNATINGAINNRYSVDLVYSVSDIAINGDVTWNTETLKYDTTGLELYVGGSKVAEGVRTEATIDVGDCTVTNYSDCDIYVGASVSITTNNLTSKFALKTPADENQTDATAGTDLLDDVMVKVADAYDGDADGEGSAKSVAFDITLTSNDWANVASDLKAMGADASTGKLVATYTIVVSDTNA